MVDTTKKHVYDHKSRVNVNQRISDLSDENLTANEEALLILIEDLKARIAKLESERDD
ncbi:MAG: hypothetical protein ABJJ69_15850 [Paracoccaceae bacterium]